MLVLLPPSETKRNGGDGPPLRLEALSHPELDPTRKTLIDELVELSGDVAASRAAIAEGELVVDLRSGSYAALGRLPGAVTATVLAEQPDGRRTVVSHVNKAHKGRLARLLATTRAEPADASTVAALARRAGLRVERPRPTDLEIVISANAT